MSRRNVKVVQPGLVYVIEWDAGGDSSPETPPGSPSPSSSTLPAVGSDTTSSGRDKRRAKRDTKRDHDKPPPELPAGAFVPSEYPIYVAYVFSEHTYTVAYRCTDTMIGNTSHRSAICVDLTPAFPMCGKRPFLMKKLTYRHHRESLRPKPDLSRYLRARR